MAGCVRVRFSAETYAMCARAPDLALDHRGGELTPIVRLEPARR